MEFWRLHGRALDALERRHRTVAAPVNPPEAFAVRQLQAQGLSLPVEVTVAFDKNRRVSPLVRSHVLSASLPQGSIIRVDDRLLVSSPELCFMQLANTLAESKLIKLGLELCGTYSLPGPHARSLDSDLAGKGFYERPALTTLKKLDALLSRMNGVRGKRQAAQALRCLANGSASPMETILTMLLTLPNRLGGYGFPLPELNALIVPAKTAKHSVSKSFYSCDLFWPDLNLAVEYDSDSHHASAERIANDSKRRNSLSLLGITVITVTNQQVRNKVEFERVAKQLAVNLGIRLRHKEKPGFVQAQSKLRALLL